MTDADAARPLDLEPIRERLRQRISPRNGCRTWTPADEDLEDLLAEVEALRAALPRQASWETAALLMDRTRQAIRDRHRAGESDESLAEDYGVPVDFVKVLCAWQLFSDDQCSSREHELCRVCEGNGVLKIPGGISTCPRCRGTCYEPPMEVAHD